MKTLAYRHEIDGLRMIAVFGAVFFHLSRVADMPPWFERLFTGGMMGVDVFFVISGYLIGGIVLREVYTGNFSFMHFYERRIRRIMPALLTVSLATVPFALVMMDAQELLDYGKSLLGISFFVSNYVFFQGLEQQELVSYLDITGYLCEGPICPIGTHEVSYYNNLDHLSVVGAKRLVPALKQAYNQ